MHNFECNECDRRFGSQHALQQHLNSSAHNFKYNECDRSFESKQALQQHLDSPTHNFECDDCDKSFESQQALRPHLNSSAHIVDTVPVYSGNPSNIVNSVYATALCLRHRKPTIDDVLRKATLELEDEIVSALIAAVLRTLPIDDTPQGIELRTEKNRARTAEAKDAEDNFCAELTQFGYLFLRKANKLDK